MSKLMRQKRRHFLANIAAMTSASAVPQLGLLSSAVAAGEQGDYKALVCLDLNGGADNFNLLIPRNLSHYQNYLDARAGIYDAATNPTGRAIAHDQLVPIDAPAGAGLSGGEYGLHPQCADRPFSAGTTPGLATLFTNEDMAFIANAGTLVQPISRAEFEAGLAPRPPAIGGHNFQQQLWRNGRADPAWKQGWGGMLAANLNDGSDQTQLSPCISLAGNNLFQVGRYPQNGSALQPYVMTASGAEKVNAFTGTPGIFGREVLEEILSQPYTNLMDSEAQRVVGLTYAQNIKINDLLRGSNDGQVNTPYQTQGNFDPATGRYPTPSVTVDGNEVSNTLLNQFRQIAQMIKLSRNPNSGINSQRQVYFLSLPGHDMHGEQMRRAQPLLIARLSQALGYFAQALKEIGAFQDVTTFTISEFGRTLTPNSGGTDHAWGNHHLVMGGAISGGRIMGRYPDVVLNANNDSAQEWSFGRGEYIPTTSVEQIGATLGRWFGASEGELDSIFPNLVNFDRDLQLFV